MKKKILLLMMSVCTFAMVQAQVGVNTQNPLGWLHVDPSGNTGGTATTPTNDGDDVIVSTTGNVGIGTANPQTKLHIVSPAVGQGFQLQDGSEGIGKVLSSDVNGRGRWLPAGSTKAILGTITNGTHSADLLDDGSGHVAYTGMNITLPRGQFLLNFSAWITMTGTTNPVMTGYGKYVSVFLSKSDTSFALNLRPRYLSNIKSILLNPLYLLSTEMSYYASGSIPVEIIPDAGENEDTLYLWAFVSSNNHTANASGQLTRTIISHNGAVGGYGPYTQLYAVPFVVN